MGEKIGADEVSSSCAILTVIVFAAYFFGYAFGKDLAEKHNAEDARAAAQFETLDI